MKTLKEEVTDVTLRLLHGGLSCRVQQPVLDSVEGNGERFSV